VFSNVVAILGKTGSAPTSGIDGDAVLYATSGRAGTDYFGVLGAPLLLPANFGLWKLVGANEAAGNYRALVTHL
jgi:hypothetical protein